jgi:hypothetical protein
MAAQRLGGTWLDLGFLVGAGEGNRTLMTSLEGWGSAIELRPRAPGQTCFAAGEHRQRTGNGDVGLNPRRSCRPLDGWRYAAEADKPSQGVRDGRLRIGQRDVAQLG